MSNITRFTTKNLVGKKGNLENEQGREKTYSHV